MSVITFPGLGLKFEFSKIAFTLFGMPIYKYAVCIVLGIITALALAKHSKEKYGIDYDDFIECIILAISIRNNRC